MVHVAEHWERWVVGTVAEAARLVIGGLSVTEKGVP